MDQDWISQYYGDSLPDEQKKGEPQPAQNQPIQPEKKPEKQEPQKNKSSEEKPRLPEIKKSSTKQNAAPDKLLQWIMDEVQKREEIRLAEERGKDPVQNEALRKILESAKQLDKQLGEILAQTGFTGDSLESFLDNPKNFSDAEWRYLNQYRASMKTKLNAILGGKIVIPEKKKSESRKKSIGSRKHWLDMH